MDREEIINYYEGLSVDELISEYLNHYVVMETRSLLLSDLKRLLNDVESGHASTFGLPEQSLQQYGRLLSQFYDEVKNTPLPESFNGGPWHYAYEIDELGARLQMSLISDAWIEDDEDCSEDAPPIYVIDEPEIPILTVPAKMLSPEEFGKLYGVTEVTVRQWIRRGKLRAVQKYGNTWLISELAEVEGRKYDERVYHWTDTIQGLPTEYNFMNGKTGLSICQSKERKDLFDVFFHDNLEVPALQMVTAEKEKFELFLLGHPQVKHYARTWYRTI